MSKDKWVSALASTAGTQWKTSGVGGKHLINSTPASLGLNSRDMTAINEEPDTTRFTSSLVMDNNRDELKDSLEVNAPSISQLVDIEDVDDVPGFRLRGSRDDPSTSSSECSSEEEYGGTGEDIDGASTIASASVVDDVVNELWRMDFDEGWTVQWSDKSEMADDSTLTSVMSSETLPVQHRQDRGVSSVPSSVNVVPCAIQVPPSSPHTSSASLQAEEYITPRDAEGVENEVTKLATNLRAASLTSQGSFGVVIDKQRDALLNIKAQKEFAKATKADDANVPVYLCNNRINVKPEMKDKALDLMRRFGHRMFHRGLTHDCAEYLRATYGDDRHTQPRKVNNNLTKLGRDQHAINHIIWHATHTIWFEYKAGSRVIHFRFPLRYRKIARDGVPVFFEEEGPTSMEPQPPIYDQEKRKKIREKIDKVIHRRYMLCTGVEIKSLIRYFGVPKGEFDVRIVYDGTANHLNSKIWVPSFWLPTVDTLIRALDANSWLADRDIGDMFLNFQLHHSVVPYTGVDLGPLYEKGEKVDPKYAFWDRNLMGIKPSPHNSIKLALIAEEVCKGDRHETGVGADGRNLNPFQWKRIRLNLPGPGYDPSLSWVSKLREDSRLACELFTFVDDERLTAPTRELAYQAAHVLAAKQSYLDIQDAARKWRPPSKTPGAWAGSVVYVYEDLGVCVLTSEEKWEKLKLILDRYHNQLKGGGATHLAHTQLASDRGFLVYVTRNYPAMVPYLKGFHLPMEMWRGDRDKDGWKVKPVKQNRDDESVVSCQTFASLDATRAASRGAEPTEAHDKEVVLDYALRQSGCKEPIYAPEDGLTPVVTRIADDVAALRVLTDSKLPPLRVVRPTAVVQVFYGFADASGTGKGFTVAGDYNCASRLSEQHTRSDGVVYRVGVWTAKEEEESSNWKEFSNVVQSIEEEAAMGKLQNCELFMSTDNAVTESCFYRGSSKSRKLHHLVLRLRLLEMKYGMVIHLIHVSGKRMIAQGTDGVSRGFLMEGVMAGDDMLSFLDLGKSAFERHPPLLDWIKSWAPEGRTEVLEPEGWFEKGHGITGGELDSNNVWIPTHNPSDQCFVWAPLPAAADVALEELAKARHKRTDTYHIITIPRLMAPKWRRLFNKVCDFSFVVSPPPFPFGLNQCMNPFGWVFYFLSHSTGLGASNKHLFFWKWEGICVGCSQTVKKGHEIFCANSFSSRNGLPPCRSAWHPEWYTCLGEGRFPVKTIEDGAGNVWRKEEQRIEQLNQGVDGAHMCIPFQCEACWIYNIEKREMEDTPDDWEYAKCIRHSNLDAMNGKAPSTIRSHRREVMSSMKYCSRIGKTPSFEARGPMPVDDTVGMGVAVEMQLKSLYSKGRINPDYSQYDTIWKTRATASKTYDSSARGVGEQASFALGKACRIRPTECPSQSEWFQDFAQGMQNRMGYESAADHGVGMRAIVKVLDYIMAEALNAEAEDEIEEANQLFKVGAFICAVTAGSMRGYEGFFLDLAGMIEHLDKGKNGEVPAVVHTNLQALLTEEMCARLPHITLCLLGNLKGEGGIGYHMINMANETTSGLKPRWWTEKVIEI